ncbi:MAG: hypothetical protein HY537_07410, partial [Deltaproteobacteria bacterium]|nr:hypothetical protein [Deltaproteobacteria bacterium]
MTDFTQKVAARFLKWGVTAIFLCAIGLMLKFGSSIEPIPPASVSPLPVVQVNAPTAPNSVDSEAIPVVKTTKKSKRQLRARKANTPFAAAKNPMKESPVVLVAALENTWDEGPQSDALDTVSPLDELANQAFSEVPQSESFQSEWRMSQLQLDYSPFLDESLTPAIYSEVAARYKNDNFEPIREALSEISEAAQTLGPIAPAPVPLATPSLGESNTPPLGENNKKEASNEAMSAQPVLSVPTDQPPEQPATATEHYENPTDDGGSNTSDDDGNERMLGEQPQKQDAERGVQVSEQETKPTQQSAELPVSERLASVAPYTVAPPSSQGVITQLNDSSAASSNSPVLNSQPEGSSNLPKARALLAQALTGNTSIPDVPRNDDISKKPDEIQPPPHEVKNGQGARRQDPNGEYGEKIFGQIAFDRFVEDWLERNNHHAQIYLHPASAEHARDPKEIVFAKYNPPHFSVEESLQGSYRLVVGFFSERNALPTARIHYPHLINVSKSKIRFFIDEKALRKALRASPSPSTNVTLTGTIFEMSWGHHREPKPIQNARISFVGFPEKGLQIKPTDAQGNFKISGLSGNSRYLIDVSANGYFGTRKAVALLDSDDYIIIYLVPQFGVDAATVFTRKAQKAGKGILVGRIFDPLNRAPKEWEGVSLLYRAGPALYFDYYWGLPNLNLKSTSKSGLFAFFNVVSGLRTLLRDGKSPLTVIVR